MSLSQVRPCLFVLCLASSSQCVSAATLLHDVPLTAYQSVSSAQSMPDQPELIALSMASGDFNGDGITDLAVSYESGSEPYLFIYPGNHDYLYPQATRARDYEDSTLAPFLEASFSLPVPQGFQYLTAGDFNADGLLDLAGGVEGQSSITFFAGIGSGGMAISEPFPLGGSLTTMIAGEVNRRDGLADIVVGIESDTGAELLVFQGPSGALNQPPQRIILPQPAASLVTGEINGLPGLDIGVAAGNELVLVHGKFATTRAELQSADTSLAPTVERQTLTSSILGLAYSGQRNGGQNRGGLSVFLDSGEIETLQVRNQEQDAGLTQDFNDGASESLWQRVADVTSIENLAPGYIASVAPVHMDSKVYWLVNREDGLASSLVGKEASNNDSASLAAGNVLTTLPLRLNADGQLDQIVMQSNNGAPGVVVSMAAATLTVNSTADSTTASDGLCTLREAIINTNDGGDVTGGDCLAGTALAADQIDFNIDGGGSRATIALTSILPDVTDPVIINGNSQCATPPCVKLDGSGVANPGDTSLNALTIDTDSSVIRGLVITDWPVGGIQLQGATGGNFIEGNHIGVDFDGITPGPLLGSGIEISSPDNTVGGTTAAARNIISANARNGIAIENTASTNASGNTISGNYVGTDITGAVDLGNTFSGIYVVESSNNTIGGTSSGAGNLVSGNQSRGILIRELAVPGKETTGNLIQGNLVGTDASGTLALGNLRDGVGVWNASGNTVGGTTAGARNVISGNGFDVNAFSGVLIFSLQSNPVPTRDNLIQGNFIGVDISGTAPLGNSRNGITLFDASDNSLGGAAPGAGNVISGNNFLGISITRGGLVTDGNMILGNRIGTNASGTAAIGNGGSGVYLGGGGATNTMIGGAGPGAGNLISGNLNGVFIQSSSNNTIQGNTIGTNAAGTVALPNTQLGLIISGDSFVPPAVATGNLVGGTDPGAGNLISGNLDNGVGLYANAPGNAFEGNFIGTNAAGTSEIPNGVSGIASFSSGAQRIGGDDPDTRNVIAGNVGQGIVLQLPASGSVVRNNFVGVGSDGTTPIPNLNNGILLVGSSNNQIGGVGVGNRIWFNVNGINLISSGSSNNQIIGNDIQNNQNIGVVLESAPASAGNTISRNILFNNNALGIDILADGPTANDNLDVDAGPNNIQNFPVLTSAVATSALVKVKGTINSAADTKFTIEYFANEACDGSNRGEGQMYLGAAQATTNASGDAVLNSTLDAATPGKPFITATATALDGSTSEFSACTAVTDSIFFDGFEPR